MKHIFDLKCKNLRLVTHWNGDQNYPTCKEATLASGEHCPFKYDMQAKHLCKKYEGYKTTFEIVIEYPNARGSNLIARCNTQEEAEDILKRIKIKEIRS